jgi:hypothetical protein
MSQKQSDTRTERILNENFKVIKDSLSNEEKKMAIIFLKVWEMEKMRDGFGFSLKVLTDYLDDYKEAGRIFELNREIIDKDVEIANLKKDKVKLIEKLKNKDVIVD